MNLSVLEERIKEEIPEEHHEAIDKEFSRFMMEANRISEDPEKIGQATLTDREIRRAPTTNQHGDYGFTVIQLQYIKAAAIKHGVRDWLSHVDPEITYSENANLMTRRGRRDTQSMRQMADIR